MPSIPPPAVPQNLQALIDQRVRMQIGDLMVTNAALAVQCEQLAAQLQAAQTANGKDEPAPAPA